jgi:hypothetical protein
MGGSVFIVGKKQQPATEDWNDENTTLVDCLHLLSQLGAMGYLVTQWLARRQIHHTAFLDEPAAKKHATI